MDDTLHATASIPEQAVRPRTYLWGRPAMTPHFTEDIAAHELEICHDVGLYRHLKFCRHPVPYQNPTTIICSFQIFTTPGSLAIAGDMGTYVFARLEDMFRFFDSPDGRINPEYWSEKVTAQDVHCPVRSYSKARFTEIVLQDFEDRKYDFDPEQQPLLRAAIDAHVLQSPDIYYEDGAREVLREFNFWFQAYGSPKIEFTYSEGVTADWVFNDFSHHFLWCLEAIVFGIRRYREVTGHV
jgi:hypothetical protein